MLCTTSANKLEKLTEINSYKNITNQNRHEMNQNIRMALQPFNKLDLVSQYFP